jgi:hypothetical protein
MSQYLESAKQQIANSVPALPSRDELTANAQNSVANAQASVANAKESINQTLNDFSSKNVMNASTEFLNSNSIVAKFLFIILILIVMLVCMKIGTAIIGYFLSPSKQPYLAKGLSSGTSNLTISQDPANKVASVLYRSNNKTGGIEFTWSTWLWVDSIGPDLKRYHIFNKGNDVYHQTGTPEGSNNIVNTTNDGLATVNNGPGLYLGVNSSGRSTNSLIFYLDVEKNNSQLATDPITLEITNIPLKKWFHVAYRFQNYSIDCYVNGILAKSEFFKDKVPKQNYDDVHIGKNGGFAGKISNLRYYDYAISAFDITTIVSYGPNLNANANEMNNNNMYDYFSMAWYSSFNM